MVIISLLLCACEKQHKPEGCNADNPLQMKWLADRVLELQNCVCMVSVFQAEYKGKTVFWQLMNDPLCQGVIANVSVFDCFGEEILVLENFDNWVDFTSEVNDMKIIYSCKKL